MPDFLTIITIKPWQVSVLATVKKTSLLFGLSVRVISLEVTLEPCGVRSGPMVKSWGLWTRDLGSIPCIGSHLWFGWPKNTGGPLGVHKPTRNLKISLCLFAKSSRFRRALYRVLFEYYGLLCTLERITLSALKTRQDPKGSNYLYTPFLKFMDLIKCWRMLILESHLYKLSLDGLQDSNLARFSLAK